MAEITDQGYVLKTQNEWYADEQARYLAIDQNWNLDPSTPDGLKLATDAEIWSALDELGQQAYNSKDPAKATKHDLDVVSAITGTLRSVGTPSNVALTLGGVAGTVILAGKQVKSAHDGTLWVIDDTVTIGPGGTIPATATCTTLGAVQASIGTITKIYDTVGGWQTVTNPSVATLGTDEQTDPQLRIERALAVAKPGNNQIDNLLGQILSVDGVRRCVVYENEESTTDSNGLPGHSFAAIIDGGTNADVAYAIYVKKNPGVKQYQAGTPVTVTVTSKKYPKQTKDIKFGRPTYVDMIMIINIANDGTLPSNASDLIKSAIIDYAAGDFVANEDGVSVQGFDIGEDVPFSRMYAPIQQVLGAYGNSYVSSMTLNGGTSNIVIAFDALSRWTASNITVNII